MASVRASVRCFLPLAAWLLCCLFPQILFFWILWLPGMLMASFPSRNFILKSIVVLSRCLLSAFRLCRACKFARFCISLRSKSLTISVILYFFLKVECLEQEFSVCFFFFLSNYRVWKRGTNLRKVSVSFCCFFLVTEYDTERERERDVTFLTSFCLFLIHKEGLTIFFISWWVALSQLSLKKFCLKWAFRVSALKRCSYWIFELLLSRGLH